MLTGLGVAVCLATAHAADAADRAAQKALVARVHSDVAALRHAVFDLARIEKLTGVRLIFDRQGAITKNKIFRPLGRLKWPYVKIEYELRSEDTWAGLMLSIDRKYCISPRDLDDFFPMSEGVLQSTDHSNGDDVEIGFGDDVSRVWIVYQKGRHVECARQFKVEATR